LRLGIPSISSSFFYSVWIGKFGVSGNHLRQSLGTASTEGWGKLWGCVPWNIDRLLLKT
jgi:hypothetical protein